jgi:hypothetical protein
VFGSCSGIPTYIVLFFSSPHNIAAYQLCTETVCKYHSAIIQVDMISHIVLSGELPLSALQVVVVAENAGDLVV